ncbi:MAG: hypothetical protein M3220_22075 [Chloroflexota bacterium]|nr:hypothetical protein [Chloroflexota bacterium]
MMTGGHRRSQLFLIRLWTEKADDGRVTWRGKVQQTVSGEAHHFYDWPTLIALLEQALPGAQSNSSTGGLPEN